MQNRQSGLAPLAARITLWVSLLVLCQEAIANPTACTDGERNHASVEAELAIYELVVADEQVLLSDGLMAYRWGGGIYLSVEALIDALGYAIHAQGSYRWTGTTGVEQTPFSLDLQRCEVSTGGRRELLRQREILFVDSTAYMHIGSAENWFPIELRENRQRMSIAVNPLEPLPIQKQLARRKRWENASTASISTQAHRTADTSYLWWDWPSIHASLETRYRRPRGSSPGYSGYYKLVGASDFARMNGEFAIMGSARDGIDHVFGTLSRRNPSGGLLGPLDATEFAVGDVVLSRDPLIANHAVGQGFTITNSPLTAPLTYDEFAVQGELPLGWDVELLKNDRLVAFETGSSPGHYELSGVPLDYGQNEFRLLLYGPQGQVREKVIRRMVGSDMAPPGEHLYRLSAARERDEFGYGSAPGNRISFDYDYGVSKAISLGVMAKTMDFQGERHNYVGTHVGLSLPGVYSRFTYVADVSGGQAVAGNMTTRLAGFDLSLEAGRYEDMVSERSLSEPVPGSLEASRKLRMARHLGRLGGGVFDIQASFAQRNGTLGDVDESQASVSYSHLYGKATHVYEQRQIDTGHGDWQTARQRLLFSTRWKSVVFRGNLMQELEPEEYLNTVGVYADWSAGARTRFRFGVNRSPHYRLTTYSAGLNVVLSGFSVGADVSSTDNGAITAGLTFSSTLSRNPLDGGWAGSSTTTARSGSVVVNAFLDQNANEQQDSGEPPVKGAAIRIAGHGSSATTDAEGQAYVEGLAPDRRTSLRIDEASLDNPFWHLDGKGVVIYPRAGRTAHVVIPVTPTGSIDGVTYRNRGGDYAPAPGVRINLIRMDGTLAAESTSAYDGYYSFDAVIPGRYRLRAGPARLNKPRAAEDVLIHVKGGASLRSIGLAIRL